MRLLHYKWRIDQLSDRYTLTSLLGSGSIADVYLAYDEREKYKVAVKVIKPDVLDPIMLQRFLRAGNAIGSLNHSHIIHIYCVQEETFPKPDSTSSGGCKVTYIVMEYAQEGDLEKRLVSGKAHPLNETVRIFEQLCEAVQYAHNQGVIHGGIRPANILFRDHPSKGDQVVLSDFGLAMADHETLSRPNVGTFAYMAIEQQQGSLQKASDIFSLGVVLYQLCTGHLPVASQPLKKPTDLNPTLPSTLDDVILRALSNEPTQRFVSASLFWQAIQSAVRETLTPVSAELPIGDPGPVSKADFFISYAWADLFPAQWIQTQLEQAGYSTVLPSYVLPSNSDFEKVMNEAIAFAKCVVTVVTENYASEFSDLITFLHDLRQKTRVNPEIIVPVYFGEPKHELKKMLKSIKYFDLSVPEEPLRRKLLLAAVRGKGVPPLNASSSSKFPETQPGFSHTPSASSVKSLEIFISYSDSDKDKEMQTQLERHLSSLTKQGLISPWHYGAVNAGDVRVDEVNKHLSEASIILLLISPDYIASPNCSGKEMRQALDRHEKHEACVIPIILRSTLWKNMSFGKLEPLPEGGKPIDLWHNLDEALVDVVRGIERVVKRFIGEPFPA